MTLIVHWAQKSYWKSAVALLAYFALILLFWSVMYARVLGSDRNFSALSGFDKFRLFDYFIAESFLVIVVAVLLLNRSLASRIAFIPLLTAYQLLSSLQFLSFYFSHDFLILDALGNTGDANMLISPVSVLFLAAPLVFTALFFLLPFATGGVPCRSARERILLSGVLLTFGLLLHEVLEVIPPRRAAQATLQANRLYHNSPGLATARLLRQYLLPNRQPIGLTDEDIEQAIHHGFHYNKRSGYPLIKDWIYREPFPYPPSAVRGQANVIIIFAESLSARRLGAYGSTARDITPNIDRFARDNMRVVNYYNHTAATYRGIRGQLCSIFPTFCGIGGWDDSSDKIPNMKVHGLPKIFSQMGYRTIFIGSTPADQAKMEFQVKSIGFDDVLFKEAILEKYLVGESPLLQHRYLSDHQLFRALKLFLDKEARSNERLFVCVWNVETHANFEAASDGRRYPGGTNPVLDTTFNFDHAFGEFLEYFQGSRFNKDTLLILTADHAHMPSKEFVEVAGADYRAFFIDTIPLLVHDPFNELPSVFDAKQATSLDLAPSLLHMMRIPNQKNHFMGRSIFERQGETSVAYYGTFFYSIDREGVHDHTAGAMDESVQKSLRRFIRHTQQLEVRDNLWDSQ